MKNQTIIRINLTNFLFEATADSATQLAPLLSSFHSAKGINSQKPPLFVDILLKTTPLGYLLCTL